jgi:hypothetical protein
MPSYLIESGKLGISSRTELAHRLGQGGLEM